MSRIWAWLSPTEGKEAGPESVSRDALAGGLKVLLLRSASGSPNKMAAFACGRSDYA